MIRGFVNGGRPEDALRVYSRVEVNDRFTFPFVVKACALAQARNTGTVVHGKILESGFCADRYVCSALVRMYSEFKQLNDARKLFDEMPDRDCIMWNSMIGAYVKCEYMELASVLFEQMPVKNVASYNAMLGGYAKQGFTELARDLFDKMLERDTISWNTMIGAYAKQGSVVSAWEMIDEMPHRKTSSWSALISGFAQSSCYEDALHGFREMLLDGHGRPNQAALVSAISSCSNLGSLHLGVWLHCYIIRKRMENIVDDVLGASLIDMYSKCGFLQGALSMFNNMPLRGVCSWTAMIHGLALHRKSEEALALFSEMEKSMIKPNAITFVAVLSACSHAGLVQRGREIFYNVENVYGMKPTVEMFACMVDLLCRVGKMEEACRVVESMPMEPDEFIKGSLLSGFAAHGANHDGMVACADNDLVGGGMNILASNICASGGRWEAVERVRRRMVESGTRKEPGGSMIEVEHCVHEFLAG